MSANPADPPVPYVPPVTRVRLSRGSNKRACPPVTQTRQPHGGRHGGRRHLREPPPATRAQKDLATHAGCHSSGSNRRQSRGWQQPVTRVAAASHADPPNRAKLPATLRRPRVTRATPSVTPLEPPVTREPAASHAGAGQPPSLITRKPPSPDEPAGRHAGDRKQSRG